MVSPKKQSTRFKVDAERGRFVPIGTPKIRVGYCLENYNNAVVFELWLDGAIMQPALRLSRDDGVGVDMILEDLRELHIDVARYFRLYLTARRHGKSIFPANNMMRLH